jgi:hypothetical protein
MRTSTLRKLAASALVPFLLAIQAAAVTPARAAEADAKPVPTKSVSLEAGFVFLDADGGQTILPYGYLESHPTAGFSLFNFLPSGTSILFSGRYDGDEFYDVSIEGNHRGQVELSLGSNRFPKNAVHGSLPVSNTGLSSYFSEDLSPGDEYRTDIGQDSAGLRWRTPAYPAHVSLAVSRYSMKGDVQQRFLDRSCTTRCHAYTQTRKVDSRVDTVRVGLDAHLGPFDVAYAFKALDYEDAAATPTWKYGPLSGYRTPGELEHNANPDIRSGEHRMALSTSHTGRFTAVTGWALGTRVNEDAEISQEYGTGTADLTWRPDRRVSIALRYLRRERDDEVDGAESQAMRIKLEAPAEYGSIEDRLSAAVTFKPSGLLRLRLDGLWRKVEREDAEAWELPERTETTELRALAQVRPSKSLTADLQYRRKMADDPAYAQTPTDSDEGSVKVDWRPVMGLFVQGICTARWGRNDESVLPAGDGEYEPDWEEQRYLYQANVTYAFPERATLGFHYNHFDNEVTEDLMIVPDTKRFPTDGTLHDMRIDQVMLTASWKPSDPLELRAETSYLSAAGEFQVDVAPYDNIGDLSRFETVQWTLALDGTYRWVTGWSAGVRTTWTDLDDRSAEDADESVAGVSVTVGKTW